MAISYNNLWKTLIDRGINKKELCDKVGISSSTVAKMTKGESVTLTVVERICKELNCKLNDVVEIKFDNESATYGTNKRISEGISVGKMEKMSKNEQVKRKPKLIPKNSTKPEENRNKNTNV